MSLITIVVVIILVGVLLWAANLIPMNPTVKMILNAVVIICLVVWLLQVFGLMHYLHQFKV